MSESISKIRLPNSETIYLIKDSTALHDSAAFDEKGAANTALQQAKSYADGLVASVIHFKGAKANSSEIKSLKNANKGDIWLATNDSTEWLCKENISGQSNTESWEMLGKTYDAASNTHIHNVTVSPNNKTTIYSMDANGSVSKGTPASIKSGFYKAGTAATYTGHSFSANEPTKINTEKFNAGNFPSLIGGSFSKGSFPTLTSGVKPTWTASVSDGILTFNFEQGTFPTTTGGALPNCTFPTLSGGKLPSLENGFYTPGTKASHTIGTFNGGSVTTIDTSKFDGGTPTTVSLPTRSAVNDVWVGTDKVVTTGQPK